VAEVAVELTLLGLLVVVVEQVLVLVLEVRAEVCLQESTPLALMVLLQLGMALEEADQVQHLLVVGEEQAALELLVFFT
jgi:hypothetical protein